MVAEPTLSDCPDLSLLNAWHPVAAAPEIRSDQTVQVLGATVGYGRSNDSTFWAQSRADGRPLAVTTKFGYLWVCLGDDPQPLFDIAEFDEPDRRIVHGGTIGVATSAPRAVENFLDMGHFPFVHGGILGESPFTEVTPYDVTVDDHEVVARNCRFYQPRAAAAASGGQISDYTYRIPHPHCTMLYKSSPVAPDRYDVIGLFVLATSAETVLAHNFLCLIDEHSSLAELRRFQLQIFGQDKPILENQRPKRLPLDPHAEVPIRADASSIAYRRWLTRLGVTYTTIAAAS